MAQENFSQFLRRRRRELGLSQEDLSEVAGVSANYLAKLETDRREPGLNALKLLSPALKVPVDELVNILMHSWPSLSRSNIEPRAEFVEFPEKLQSVLVEIGYLVQRVM